MIGNNIVQNTINYFKEQRILVGLSLVFLGLLVVSFWENNSLEIYDAPGHVSLVWYIKNYLWPSFMGWNPFFLAGFPQGIFYPPLFHWVAATLSFLADIETSIKIIISLVILSLPFAAYFVAKNTIPDTKYHIPTTLLIMIFLAVLPNFLGIGFRGLFQIGLIPNFVSTVLLFIFIGLLHRDLKQGKILLLALVHASLILTHIVAVASAEIYLFIYAFFLWRRGELKVIPFIWLLTLASAITAFFWVPFWANFSFTSVSAHVPSYFTLNIVLAAVAAGLLFYSLRSRLTEAGALSTFAVVITLVAALDSWLITNNIRTPVSDTLYSLHFYRFQPYAYLALILGLGSLMSDFGLLRSTRLFRFGSLGLFLVLLAYLIFRSPVVTGSKFTVEDTKLDGRFIESSRRTESEPLIYTAQTKLAMQNPENNPWAYGLFTDATPNGPYLGSLIRSLRPEAYPEGEGKYIETKFISEKNVKKAVDLFGIKYVLNLGEEKGEIVGSWQVGDRSKIYNTETVGEGVLAEVVDLAPIPAGRDFDKKVEEWWDQEGEWSTLPFKSEPGTDIDNLDTNKFDLKTQVGIVEHNRDWTKMKINIASEAPQPVLVKVSYFPWWSATKDGQNVQIYRAAPNLMLVFAKGEVDLEFKKPVWLNFLYLVSAITFLTLGFLVVKKFLDNL
ncbi:MAG: hypothetical protein WD231_05185 [Candidatus Woykebacteria bacterium]